MIDGWELGRQRERTKIFKGRNTYFYFCTMCHYCFHFTPYIFVYVLPEHIYMQYKLCSHSVGTCLLLWHLHPHRKRLGFMLNFKWPNAKWDCMVSIIWYKLNVSPDASHQILSNIFLRTLHLWKSISVPQYNQLMGDKLSWKPACSKLSPFSLSVFISCSLSCTRKISHILV